MLPALIVYKYWILIPLGIIEGPILAFACGAASSLGYLNPFAAYGILVLCAVLPDFMYYSIGRYGKHLTFSKNPTSRLRKVRDSLTTFEPLWEKYDLVAMTSAELAYGVSSPFIVSAGLSHMLPGRFLRLSFFVSLIHLGFLLLMGYLFASYYLALKNILRDAEIIVGIAAALFLVAFFLSTRYLRLYVDKKYKRS